MPRLRSALALVLAAIVWTASASAAQAAGWIDGPRFGGDGVPAFAALDLAANGTATVAWVEPIVAGGEPTMHLQQVAPDGTPQGIRTLGAADVSEPSLALTPRGDGVLVWVDDALAVDYAAIGADGSRGTTHSLGPTVRGWASAAIDDAGTATIAWLGAASDGPGEAIRVLRLRADGSRTPVRELPAGAAGTTDSLRAATAPDGTSWIAWNAPGPATTSSTWAARIDAAGEIAQGPQALSAPGFEVSALRLTASAAGAVVTWVEEDDESAMRAVGVRLPVSGGLAGEPLAIAPAMPRAPSATTSTIAPDGTVTAVWPVQGTGSSLVLAFRSFPPTGAPTAPRQISTGTGIDGVEHSPALGALPGGALLLAAIRDLDEGGGPQIPELVVRRIEGDGTVGADRVLGQVTSFPAPALLAVGERGGAFAGGYEGDVFESLKLKTWLQPAPPQPGPPVPPTTPPPPGPPAPSPDQPRAPVTRRAAAGLKLGTVTRRGARVTVRGTIARRAGGRVTVTWSQRIGRRTVVRKTTARIVRGRWTATLRMTDALATTRAGRATVKVAYRGDADTRAGSAKRTVRAARRAAAKRAR